MYYINASFDNLEEATYSPEYHSILWNTKSAIELQKVAANVSPIRGKLCTYIERDILNELVPECSIDINTAFTLSIEIYNYLKQEHIIKSENLLWETCFLISLKYVSDACDVLINILNSTIYSKNPYNNTKRKLPSINAEKNVLEMLDYDLNGFLGN